jgi:hypothetical protein
VPYREKTAWLSLIAMVVTYVPYFAIVVSGFYRNEAMPGMHQLSLLAAASIARLILLGVGYLLLMGITDKADRTPPDERDQAIVRRSMSSAYYVLISGMIYVGCFMPFTYRGWIIVQNAIFMIVVAEIVRVSVIAVSYRRQA